MPCHQAFDGSGQALGFEVLFRESRDRGDRSANGTRGRLREAAKSSAIDSEALFGPWLL